MQCQAFLFLFVLDPLKWSIQTRKQLNLSIYYNNKVGFNYLAGKSQSTITAIIPGCYSSALYLTPVCRHEPDLLAAKFCVSRGECLLRPLPLPGGGQGQDSCHQADLHGQHPGGEKVRQPQPAASVLR